MDLVRAQIARAAHDAEVARHDLLVGATFNRASGQLLVAANGLANCGLPIGVGQSGVDTFPKRLGKRYPVGKRKSHRLFFELLSGHASQASDVRVARQRGARGAPVSQTAQSV